MCENTVQQTKMAEVEYIRKRGQLLMKCSPAVYILLHIFSSDQVMYIIITYEVQQTKSAKCVYSFT